jgi:hypothetical protein
MVKNPSPQAREPLERSVPPAFPSKRNLLVLTARALVASTERGRVIALWPCGTIRSTFRDMVNREYRSYLWTAGEAENA